MFTVLGDDFRFSIECVRRVSASTFTGNQATGGTGDGGGGGSVLGGALALSSSTSPGIRAISITHSSITNNIARGQTLGLPFNATEYLSGEHSGLFRTPQQPVDNPNFGAALTQQGITSIGADASSSGL